MARRLLQESSVDRLAAMASTLPPASGAGGVHKDTLLILAAVLCFLLCVVGLALLARCSRLCNPSAFSVDSTTGAMAANAPCSKGMKTKALQSLPTTSWEQRERDGEEVPECAICLAEFASGDEVRVLPPCGHGFHAACVDLWLVSCSSTCPSCRRALVVSPPATESPATCSWSATDVAAATGGSSEGGCRSSAPEPTAGARPRPIEEHH